MDNKIHVANRRRKLKALVVQYMGEKCHRCGWDEYQSGLVPHHVDPSTKSFAISRSGKTLKWQTIRAECDKCILLCMNCHQTIHATKEKYYFDTSNIPTYTSLEDPDARTHKSSKCIDCGKKVCRYSKRCRICNGKFYAVTGNRYGVIWPPYDELCEMVKSSNYSNVAKSLGVSDNAVRKRIKTRASASRLERETNG